MDYRERLCIIIVRLYTDSIIFIYEIVILGLNSSLVNSFYLGILVVVKCCAHELNTIQRADFPELVTTVVRGSSVFVDTKVFP